MNEKDIEASIFNELGDPYHTIEDIESEGKELNQDNGASPDNTILRTLKDFEVFDSETGALIPLEDISSLRKSRGAFTVNIIRMGYLRRYFLV